MASKNTNDLSPIIGDCGIFHVILTLAVHSATLASAWGSMFMAFGAYNPGWMCIDQLEDVNLTNNDVMTSTSRTLGSKKTVNSTQWTLDCDTKGDCESLIFNNKASTVVTEWDLLCDLSWVPSMIISIQMTGALFGSYFGGQIGDRFGRKVSLYLNVAIHGICHLLAMFSVSWQMYTTISSIIGFSAGGILSNTYPFPLEFANEYWRGAIMSVPIWNISFLLFVLTALALRNWKYLHMVSAIICAVSFLTIFWTPESVRWLAVSGKIVKAKDVVARISRLNHRPCPDTSAIDDIAREERIKMTNHTYNYLDLFRTPVLRGYSIKFAIIWITMSIVYYGITFGIRAFSGDFYLNLIISTLLEMPCVVAIGPLANKFGRRIASLVFFVLVETTSIVLVVMSLVTYGTLKNISIVILALLCKILTVAAWGAVAIHSTELYPTVIRSIHYGYLNVASRIGSIASPYLIPTDPDNLYIAFIIIGVLGIINLGLIWSLPESKGNVMKDTTFEIEPEAMPMQNEKNDLSSAEN